MTKLKKVYAGRYEMTDERGRKVEVGRIDSYRHTADWLLWVDGEKAGEWSTFKEAKMRAENLDNYLASKLMASMAGACDRLARYEDFEEAGRLRIREGAYRTAARALDSKQGLREMERVYEQLNERYRVKSEAWDKRQAVVRAERKAERDAARAGRAAKAQERNEQGRTQPSDADSPPA